MSERHSNAAIEEILRCREVARGFLCDRVAPVLVPHWDLRGRIAGMYKPKTKTLHLNPQLWDFDTIHTIETAAHEYAHAVGHILYGYLKVASYLRHGQGWIDLMRAFGHEPQRTHDLPLKRSRPVKRYLMGCPCGAPHPLGPRRYARHVKARAAGSPGYVCSICRKPLILIREEFVQ